MAAGQCRAAYPVATGIPMPDGMHEPAAHLGPRSRRTKENCKYIEGAGSFFLKRARQYDASVSHCHHSIDKKVVQTLIYSVG
jgi:hypothetical protein